MIITPRPLRDRMVAPGRQRGFFTLPGGMGASRPSGGGAVDPNFANVSLLLHMDGTNGSTTFLDNGPTGHSVTAGGNAQISTAQSKWGGASGLFDGSGDYVATGSHANFGFGTGAYCVEGWVRQSATPSGYYCVFDNRGASAQGIAVYVTGTVANEVRRLMIASNTGILAGIGTTQIPADTWTHWAVTHSGTTTYGFVSGVQVWSVTDSRTLASSSTATVGANYVLSQGMSGYLDDVRVTKGVARYTSGFTPPAAAFPNS